MIIKTDNNYKIYETYDEKYKINSNDENKNKIYISRIACEILSFRFNINNNYGY